MGINTSGAVVHINGVGPGRSGGVLKRQGRLGGTKKSAPAVNSALLLNFLSENRRSMSDEAWLRDHCAACGSLGTEPGKATRSWTALLSAASANASVTSTELLNGGTSVRVNWSDGLEDTIDKIWLHEHAL
jgi:hypothetical protein